MSSQRRIDSSRANGAKSRGPVSPEGRARSRAAGLTHGLRSGQLLLEGESEEQFNALREKHLAEYQPQTRFRSDLVDQLVAAHWRHNRVLGLQTALMDRQIARQEPEIRDEYKVRDAEPPAATAGQHLCDDSRAVETLSRYETRLSAELRHTLKLLGAPVENQKLHEEPNDAEPPHSEEDSSFPEAPRFPSAIDHPRRTTKDAQLENRKLHEEPSRAQPPHSHEDGPAAQAPPSTIDHPPSTPPSPENEPPKLPLMVSRSMK